MDDAWTETAVGEAGGLTSEEDGELRRLGFVARFGALDEIMKKRIVELRAGDRRKKIREPRWGDTGLVTREVLRMIPPSQRPRDNADEAEGGAVERSSDVMTPYPG